MKKNSVIKLAIVAIATIELLSYRSVTAGPPTIPATSPDAPATMPSFQIPVVKSVTDHPAVGPRHFSKEDEEAFEEAIRMLNQHWSKYGDAYISLYGHDNGKGVVYDTEVDFYEEQKSVHAIISSSYLSEADRLNGYTWRGTISFAGTAKRRYILVDRDGKKTGVSDLKRGWSQWTDNGLDFCYISLAKLNGAWSGGSRELRNKFTIACDAQGILPFDPAGDYAERQRRSSEKADGPKPGPATRTTAEPSSKNGSPSAGGVDRADAPKAKILPEDPSAQQNFEMAEKYLTATGADRDYNKAALFLRKAADAGHATAEAKLGGLYLTGNGVTKNYVDGIALIRKSVDQHDSEGERWLGIAYEMGWGEEKDLDAAMKWALASAGKGNNLAEYHLGLTYLAGKITRKNPTEAKRWFQQGAEAGYAPAQFSLGKMLYEGTNVQMDRAEGLKWLRTSAKAGNVAAQQYLHDRHLGS